MKSYLATRQARHSGSFPTFRLSDINGRSIGLYTRTAHATNLIAKQHPVGNAVDRPYQIGVDDVAFSVLTE